MSSDRVTGVLGLLLVAFGVFGEHSGQPLDRQELPPMFNDHPATGFAYLAAPAEHYSDAVRWLADRIANPTSSEQEDEAVLFGAAAVNGPADEVKAGDSWTVEDFV